MNSFESINPSESTNFLESERQLLKTLTEKLGSPDLAEDFQEQIVSMSNQYELTVGKLRELYELTNKVIKGEIKQDDLLDHLLEKIKIRDDELAQVTAILEDIISQIQEKSGKDNK